MAARLEVNLVFNHFRRRTSGYSKIANKGFFRRIVQKLIQMVFIAENSYEYIQKEGANRQLVLLTSLEQFKSIADQYFHEKRRNNTNYLKVKWECTGEVAHSFDLTLNALKARDNLGNHCMPCAGKKDWKKHDDEFYREFFSTLSATYVRYENTRLSANTRSRENRTVSTVFFLCACNKSEVEGREFLNITTTLAHGLDIVCASCAFKRGHAAYFKDGITPDGTAIKYQGYEIKFIRWLLKLPRIDESMLLNDRTLIPVIYYTDGEKRKAYVTDIICYETSLTFGQQCKLLNNTSLSNPVPYLSALRSSLAVKDTSTGIINMQREKHELYNIERQQRDNPPSSFIIFECKSGYTLFECDFNDNIFKFEAVLANNIELHVGIIDSDMKDDVMIKLYDNVEDMKVDYDDLIINGKLNYRIYKTWKKLNIMLTAKKYNIVVKNVDTSDVSIAKAQKKFNDVWRDENIKAAIELIEEYVGDH